MKKEHFEDKYLRKLNRIQNYWDWLIAIFLGSGIAGWILLTWIQLRLGWSVFVAVYIYFFITLIVLEASSIIKSVSFNNIQVQWILVTLATASFTIGGLVSITF